MEAPFQTEEMRACLNITEGPGRRDNGARPGWLPVCEGRQVAGQAPARVSVGWRRGAGAREVARVELVLGDLR